MVEDIPSFEEYETEHIKKISADDQKPLSDFMVSFIEDSEIKVPMILK